MVHSCAFSCELCVGEKNINNFKARIFFSFSAEKLLYLCLAGEKANKIFISKHRRRHGSVGSFTRPEHATTAYLYLYRSGDKKKRHRRVLAEFDVVIKTGEFSIVEFHSHFDLGQRHFSFHFPHIFLCIFLSSTHSLSLALSLFYSQPCYRDGVGKGVFPPTSHPLRSFVRFTSCFYGAFRQKKNKTFYSSNWKI